MRIVMDLQGAQSESRYRGIGRYSLSLAQSVARQAGGHDIHLALNGIFADSVREIRAAFAGILPAANIHVWHAPMPVIAKDQENLVRRERACLIREAALAALEPDFVFVSSLFEGFVDNSVVSVGRLAGVPTIVTLYDLIPYLNPEVYLDPDPVYRAFYEEKIAELKAAHALFSISESSSREAVEVVGCDPERLYNISAACDPVFRVLERDDPARLAVRRSFGLRGGFVLYTGGSDYRKNLMRLLQAYAGLAPDLRLQHKLVLAGRMHAPHVEELNRAAAELGLAEGELRFTGYVTDEELVGLYNECSLFAFPSWHEGFGLPVVEAMACGAAVIASDASSVKEIVLEPAALFDPMSVESIRERMAAVLGSTDLMAQLRRYSASRAKDYAWERVGASFIAACEQLHAQRAGGHAYRDDALGLLPGRLAKAGRANDAELMALADAIDRSIGPVQPKIMIDVSELAAHDHRTGIQRVTRAIVSEWTRRAPPGYRVQLIRIDRAGRRYVCANEYAGALLGEEMGADETLVCHAGDIYFGLDLVGDCVSLLPDWFDYFRNSGVKISFVVYDILPIRNPEWWPQPGGQMHERWLRDILRVSDQLVCISRAVADDVAAWIGENDVATDAQIEWFHLGADIDGSQPSRGMPQNAEQVLARIKRNTSFLMVGTLEPRKGHAQILDAFEKLWEQGYDHVLVIVGKKGWLVDELSERLSQHPQSSHNLFWLQGASDEYLDQLYANSTCLIAASEGEGFGLPLIEAAQRGKPMIARDIPVFREVAGSHAFYFDGRSAVNIANALLRWTALYREDRHPRPDAMPWLTWSQSASQLGAVLTGALPEASEPPAEAPRQMNYTS
ncbi:glycosyltransferase family 4 protein [Xanthomonas sp. CFBP 8703]|uniref:Glycosyltransferase family 4 protein n=1 Tax=Xanthomonas bonasiae TaxID=2810351 RepID=A0ABS3B4M0_9XANT|nr:glycosyltransferase family 1 protein [Xanthomonas bonasiae]MBN6103308.1 glycosyltransferase family 4 protein [Xanthomonas bonasiae]